MAIQNDFSADQVYLTAHEAAELLGVKLPTVYAYTSRGLIQSIPGGHGRARLYRRRDLERLRARRDARAGHGPVAAAALRWGEPVLDSSITAISVERGPYYRGQSALELAEQGVAFETVAELLWSGSEHVDDVAEGIEERWLPDGLGVPVDQLRALVPPEISPIAALSPLVTLIATGDPGRYSERPDAVLPRARRLLRRMAAGLALGRSDSGSTAALEAALEAPSVASAAATALGASLGDEAIAALNRGFVLAADHELNASTFAARVAASTGADVYACVSAALATLSGPRHGGAADRVEALLLGVSDPGEVERVVHERQRRGEGIEGFGHPIYRPGHDPRGAMLVEIARELSQKTGSGRGALALVEAMREAGYGGPTIDVGLVAVARALELPQGSAAGLFAVSRCAGWVAHILEQYEAGFLLRPRARYLEPA